MKHFITLLMIMFVALTSVGAQTVRKGNNFSVESSTKASATQTEYTFTYKGKDYPVFVSKTGRCYIKVTSKNGKEYNKYLPEDIARTICKELGITYKEKA